MGSVPGGMKQKNKPGRSAGRRDKRRRVMLRVKDEYRCRGIVPEAIELGVFANEQKAAAAAAEWRRGYSGHPGRTFYIYRIEPI